ncbi:Uncharacterised protein [Salmonella enterica subsp. enterica]|uniref:Uncharacterized protein n=1 Tax=Salmonella enterica I TaxID=59201 RepID=A0A379X105_SALET|nr:Uncharacterised protein [Salmonella enterica subsp. enterica]
MFQGKLGQSLFIISFSYWALARFALGLYGIFRSIQQAFQPVDGLDNTSFIVLTQFFQTLTQCTNLGSWLPRNAP